MNRQGKVLILIILLLVAICDGFAQSGTQQIDTLRLKEQKKKYSGEESKQNSNTNGKVQSSIGNEYQVIKQVRSGRPDMTRSGGARPSVIVRPSGSGIPKGAGRPGGAGPKGRR